MSHYHTSYKHKSRIKCTQCDKHNSTFQCITCKSNVCIYCAYVTVIQNKWNFYCSLSCVPSSVMIVDSYLENRTIEENKENMKNAS
jgi:hypothetical protein